MSHIVRHQENWKTLIWQLEIKANNSSHQKWPLIYTSLLCRQLKGKNRTKWGNVKEFSFKQNTDIFRLQLQFLQEAKTGSNIQENEPIYLKIVQLS